MDAEQFGGLFATAGGFGVLVYALLRAYLTGEAERATLLERYQSDIANRDARIERLEREVIDLRVALDGCRQRRDER